jgi:hypothetical protein
MAILIWLTSKGDLSMWNTGWARLAGLGMVCLAAGQLSAAPATQPAKTQAAATYRALYFSLATSAYPAGTANEEQHQQYLARELREANTLLESSREDDANRIEQLLQIATFALTRASEPDLTRIWLWRQPQAAPELAVRALDLARNALAAAGRMVERSTVSETASAHADRVHMLNALLAMEGVLLGPPSPMEALRAADLADAVAKTVPAEAEATWELLIAGCLEKAGQREDAQLRLQRLLRRHKGSAQAVAAVMLQARMLAEAGNYAAGVGLVSEHVQALPTLASQPADASVTTPGDKASDAGIMGTSLSLLRATLLAAWAERIEKSKNDLDRQSASDLRKQALDWQGKAEAYGPQLIRLQPMLEALGHPTE